MASEVVSAIYQDFEGLKDVLGQTGEVSGLVALERIYPKVLLLASASHLEAVTTEMVASLWDASPRQELRTFVERRSLDRSYHSLFDWTAPNAAKFFAYFGPDCNTRFKAYKRQDEEFSVAVDSFLEIGSLRNRLVHQDYATFVLEKTAEEIIALDGDAVRFPAYIKRIVFDELELSA